MTNLWDSDSILFVEFAETSESDAVRAELETDDSVFEFIWRASAKVIGADGVGVSVRVERKRRGRENEGAIMDKFGSTKSD